MGSPLMFEDVDPSMVQEVPTHQLDLKEAADHLEVKRRRRRHPRTEQEILLAELALNIELLRSVVSLLLQVSEAAAV